MSKKSDILKIWQECFPADSAEWKKMFFDSAYSDDLAMTIEDPVDNITVSSLLLLPYAMRFHGERVGMAYIYGAGTLKKYRARGFMGRLMRLAVAEASSRGDTFIGLIPASDSLRRYYSRFGFVSVGYSRPARFTSRHRFPVTEEGAYVDGPEADAALYDDFVRLTENDRCRLLQTQKQFRVVMDDVRLSCAPFASVADAESGRVVAMAWGRLDEVSGTLRVNELISESEDAANAALNRLRDRYENHPITLMTHPSATDEGGNLAAGAMLRVVNPEKALVAIAAANPSMPAVTVRITDDLIPENTATYQLRNGRMELVDSIVRPDLDVNPGVLTSVMFSSASIGEVMGLPACRPRLTLMLD